MDRNQQNRRTFFSEQNEAMLYGILAKNFEQRLGTPMNQKQSSRLERALEHYMSEVFKSNVPVQTLNKETLTITASDFNDYILRQESLATVTSPQAFQETSTRFEQTIKEDDSISALTMFEEAKKRRNMEMNSQAETQMSKRAASASQPLYLQGSEGLPQRPDPRVLFDRPLDMVLAGQSGQADVNPTLARPGTVASRSIGQQDMIIKQQDIQSYKETEYNLSIYSADRKWEMDTSENRYNFSVNLYSGNPTNGVSVMPKATARFRNIVRVEFIKVIMPIENTDLIVRKTAPTTYNTEYLKNIFGYPFITLNVDELDTNTYGTSNTMDNAFGILQYDANWMDNTESMGFTSLIPKHMKCQRIYSPTPLATLNKLTIRLQQPNGDLVNTTPDTLDVSGVALSIGSDLSTFTGATLATNYTDTTGEYIWIKSKQWFSKYQVSAGDRIQIRNLGQATGTAETDLFNFLQSPSGLMVVETAYVSPAGTLEDGSNTAGYAQYIIVRGKFNDPRTGSTSVLPFGGAADNTALSTALLDATVTGRLINLSHQTQLIFRIVTRDYDSTALVRPDNL